MQDYVKWRGPLFHRFLLALVEDSASVRALAEYLLTDTLASKVTSFAASTTNAHTCDCQALPHSLSIHVGSRFRPASVMLLTSIAFSKASCLLHTAAANNLTMTGQCIHLRGTLN